MNIGDMLFAIKGKSIIEYTVTRIVTTETKSGADVEYYAKNSGKLFAVKKINVDEIQDYFNTKEEAQKVLEIIKKYI